MKTDDPEIFACDFCTVSGKEQLMFSNPDGTVSVCGACVLIMTRRAQDVYETASWVAH